MVEDEHRDLQLGVIDRYWCRYWFRYETFFSMSVGGKVLVLVKACWCEVDSRVISVTNQKTGLTGTWLNARTTILLFSEGHS